MHDVAINLLGEALRIEGLESSHYLNRKSMWNNCLLGYVQVFWAIIFLTVMRENAGLIRYRDYRGNI